jgi:hypothetical protein
MQARSALAAGLLLERLYVLVVDDVVVLVGGGFLVVLIGGGGDALATCSVALSPSCARRRRPPCVGGPRAGVYAPAAATCCVLGCILASSPARPDALVVLCEERYCVVGMTRKGIRLAIGREAAVA